MKYNSSQKVWGSSQHIGISSSCLAEIFQSSLKCLSKGPPAGPGVLQFSKPTAFSAMGQREIFNYFECDPKEMRAKIRHWICFIISFCLHSRGPLVFQNLSKALLLSVRDYSLECSLLNLFNENPLPHPWNKAVSRLLESWISTVRTIGQTVSVFKYVG